MKKVLIVAVCLALVLTLAFTLGALGKKPEKPPGKPEYVYELTFEKGKGLDVTGIVEQCGAQGRFISSSNIYEFRPNLCLGKKFDDYKICTEIPDGRYLDLSEHNGEITMQFFFLFKDPETEEKEKIRLNVNGGYVDPDYADGEWLSSEFRIIFDGAYAVIAPTKGKVKILWDSENVNIQVVVTSL